MPTTTSVKDSLAQEIGRLLRNKNLSIATAESCTGGLISHLITNIPGSSDYFDRGYVTYSNDSKITLLGVKPETLENYGAVSKHVAKEMARGAMENAGTGIGLATTGIAGPGGGTEEKPVGLVYIGITDSDSLFAEKFNFSGGRLEIKDRAAETGLELLSNFLSG